MNSTRNAVRTLLLWATALGLLAAGPCDDEPALVRLLSPLDRQLSQVGPVELEVELLAPASDGTVEVWLDGVRLEDSILQRSGSRVSASLSGLAPGRHNLAVGVGYDQAGQSLASWTTSWFQLAELDRPDSCDVLNGVACVLPFPSSRFLTPADTETGFRVEYPEGSLPRLNRQGAGFVPGSPEPYRQNDGFSPTAQILMHFPDGVDPALSGAARLLPETRTFDLRALEPDSPTLLLDAETGEPIAHFIENDVRATDPERVVTFLRPARSLTPGRRYVVAVRNLVNASGEPVSAEPAFAAIRDGRPTDIPAVERRRLQVEPILTWLEGLDGNPVPRHDLVLAFDFVVQSDHSLTHQMLAMRDESFAWLAAQQADGIETFSVDAVEDINPDCADPEIAFWRRVEGTFQVPLYLDKDPIAEPSKIGMLVEDAAGTPVMSGFTNPPFTVAIPCGTFDANGDGELGDFAPLPTVTLGHGLFGNGRGFVEQLSEAPELGEFQYVAGATDWSGLSGPDIAGPLEKTFVVKLFADLDRFEAMPDRLRQGQLATLVLARMLKTAAFGSHPAFQSEGRAVMDAGAPEYYFGASLGGIMGLMFAALTPDVERLSVDVPAINFSLLLQRATPFIEFQLLLNVVNPGSLEQALGLGLLHELWVRGESAGYATHITSNPLPGTPAKRMLMTVALYDQQVSNLGAQIAAATLDLPNLEGSVMTGRPLLPDLPGPLPSAHVVYDTASFDPQNPDHLPFIPPLANLQAAPNRCDPHGRRGFIPASIQQLVGFLQPDGVVENFCLDDGICNASEPFEIPNGNAERCEPIVF